MEFFNFSGPLLRFFYFQGGDGVLKEERQFLEDGGPVYAETDTDALIVEPFNMASAVLFLGIVLYWWWKLHKSFGKYPYLAFVIPVLAIGGVGGTLYHGFRVSAYFLMMDYVPIMILTITTSIYFLVRSLPKWWHAALVCIPLIGAQYIARQLVPVSWSINVGYAFMAVGVVLPAVLWMRRTRYHQAARLGQSVGVFTIALLMRISDKTLAAWLPMGTHWLWHVFGGFATALMISYIHRTYYSIPPTEALKTHDGQDRIRA